jgi:hypothetical protein
MKATEQVHTWAILPELTLGRCSKDEQKQTASGQGCCDRVEECRKIAQSLQGSSLGQFLISQTKQRSAQPSELR